MSDRNSFFSRNQLIWMVIVLGAALALLFGFHFLLKINEHDALSLKEILPQPILTLQQNAEVPTQSAQLLLTNAVQSPVKSAEVESPKAEPIASKTIFAVQVGAFKEKNRARQLVESLEKRKFVAYVVSDDLKEKGVWYRVWIGRFDSVPPAQAQKQQLLSEFKNSFIVKREAKDINSE